MKPSMVIQRPTDNAPPSEATSNSFPNWFPFRFGLGFDCDSDPTPCDPRTDVDITAHAMIPSPEKIWMSPESNLNPDEMRVMKSVLSELEYDEGPLRSPESPMASPKEKGSVVPRRGRRNNKKQRAARPPQQASSPLSQDSRLQAVNLKCSSRDASPPPTVRMVQGLRVTVISEEFKVLVVDLLTPEQCDLTRNMADAHVRESGNRIPTWRTLVSFAPPPSCSFVFPGVTLIEQLFFTSRKYTYTKQDLPCGEVKHLSTRVTDGIMEAVRAVVGEVYGNTKGAAMLRARSWKEPHLLLYQHLEGKPLHTGVEMHYDGCDVTWNCMLSKSSEYGKLL